MKFTDSKIEELFGAEDAEGEPKARFKEYFVENKAYELLKEDLPLRILVGHKGVGKSALLKRAYLDDEEEGRLAVFIQPSDIEAMARVRTHWSEPEDDGCGESDGGEEDVGASVVAGCDAPPVFQAPEHDFDAVAAFVATLVVFDGFVPGFTAWNARFYALFPQGIAEPVGVVATVGQQPLRFGKGVEQRSSPSIIADLACGYEEADWATVRIGDGVQLGIHATLRAPDQASSFPFFTRRLDAVRCALR